MTTVQTRATEPAASAFVAANAGSGKTYVLTRRVMRLLLSGADPARILCLTFTKAAAAEMANRVFDELGKWATLPDDLLAAEIAHLDSETPAPARLTAARRLFARALETPGGLKVQTIHAFCEALLHRFTVEANLPPHFTIADSAASAEMIAKARDQMLLDARANPTAPLGRALSRLLTDAADKTFDGLLREGLQERDAFRAWIDSYPDAEAAMSDLPTRLGLGTAASREKLVADALRSAEFPPEILNPLLDACDAAGANSQKFAASIRLSLAAPDPDARLKYWQQAFLTEKNEARSARGFIVKSIETRLPGSLERAEREAARQAALFAQLATLVTVERTTALARVLDQVIGHYEAAKRASGSLDFSDLIAHTADLLSRSDATQWVLYKMDGGLDHILVDEAQDNSPRQWDIISALTGEFFAGAGAGDGRVRTVFAVGDAKQSIFSFQGAAPSLFAEKRKYFSSLVSDAGQVFHDLKLQVSFRSTADVVKAVDRVFANPLAHEGLSEDGATVHETHRGGQPGLVEIWREVESVAAPEPDNWEDPVDRISAGSAPLQLAEKIAAEIEGWLRLGACLASSGKPIQPGDILILVRKRGPFIEALNRGLKTRGIAVAGADRLDVAHHIITLDLLSAAKVALLPEDDLSLAEVLRSPLIGVCEETLFRWAHGRDGSLWHALVSAAADGDADAASAENRIRQWIDRRDGCFDFFADLIARDGARAAYRARFGREADEVLDECLTLALDFEVQKLPSLTHFLAAMMDASENVKREMDAARNEVRIMTVHGAKGLEAPIVFLVDPGSAPFHATHDPKLIRIDAAGNGPLIWSGTRKPEPVKAVLDDIHRQNEEEYRRLLYVGLTRARDRLVMCGIKARKDNPGQWYPLVKSALVGEASEIIHDADGEPLVWRWRVDGAAPVMPSTGTPTLARPSADDGTAPLPDWLIRPAPGIQLAGSLAPSEALDLVDLDDEAMDRGRALHALLEVLPGEAPEERDAAGATLLARFGLDAGSARALLIEAAAVIDHPAHADLFGPGSRAERAISGYVTGPDGSRLVVNGRIDRLIDLGDHVLIIDYKTNRDVPRQLPAGYLAQMALYRALVAGLYPGREVRVEILWTAVPRRQQLDDHTLVQALGAVLDRNRTAGA